ncbi:hypothetical protein BJP34_23870 [Moorena producens PAL-8-15-08-1]|uniref:Uncharacterized protein n=1 Tax=Moorena producens PAL-8-15-08-1 TaxID=1458985 RepID=A0A1D8TWQ3_9CYAN|nr:hypothetical protein [Moorena producens]AOX02068.1 hypothetical protein BJP34_23870 [Moorena producens PAL-8-15-08-1]
MGIAHFINRRLILIFISNAHPRILNSSFYIQMGIGGHCPFNCWAFNFDLSTAMPTLGFSILHSTFKWVLVGIAHLIVGRLILIFISNAHPRILNSSFYIQMGIGGHCPFNCWAFNFDLHQQCPP